MKKIKTWASFKLEKLSHKILTVEMETFLLEKLNGKERDKALDQLIFFLENTIHYTAKRYYWSNVSYDDLVAVGREGIISATETYKPNKNTKFTTFATYYIIGRIRRIVDLENNTIKKPSHINRIQSKINKLDLDDPKITDLTELIKDKVTLEQLKIALETKNQKTFDLDDYRELEYTEKAFSLDKIMVDNLLDTLPEIEKTALILKFGLKDYEIHTYKALDKVIDKDSELVVNRALKRLRENFKDDLL